MIYDVTSWILILWGVIWLIGYLVEYEGVGHEQTIWLLLDLIGFAGSIFIPWLSCRRKYATAPRPLLQRLDWRIISFMASLAGFAVLWVFLLGLKGRQIDAFVPAVFMLGYILAGFWVGRFFVVSGLIVTALVALCLLFAGPSFLLWMALLGGGALIGGGVYLRLARYP